MLKDDVTLRIAREEDAGGLLAIYAPYVEKTAVSFEYEAPTVEEFRGRICRIRKRYPYLVAEAGGEILGYAYASAFHERKAFDHAVEMSVYLREDRRRGGLGRRLYEALECILKEQNITDLCAWIAAPDGDDPYLTWDSIRFHERMGYETAGEFRRCGYKFHRWYHMRWMTKNIGGHLEQQPPVLPFAAIRERIEEKYGIS